jgi:2-hydroxychromene-2-carboxylate isomerase
MEAQWYFDFISPFAYLGLGDIESLSQELPVSYKPVVLGALLKHYGQLGPAEIPPKRLQTYRMCVWKARERDIPFHFPPAHPFNSLALLRIAAAFDADKEAVRTIFDFVWKEGRDPQSEQSLAVLCERLAIADVDALIERTNAREKLRRNTETAIAAGVFGVPTLALGDELFWGTEALPMAKVYLLNPNLFDEDEMRLIAHLPSGIERRR